MRACELLEPDYLVHMLKAVKHLSMNASMLEVLQNANAIEILVRILDEHSTGPHSTVRYVFPPCFDRRNNMGCRYRKWPITSSKRVTIFVASTKLDKRRRLRLELSQV